MMLNSKGEKFEKISKKDYNIRSGNCNTPICIQTTNPEKNISNKI